MTTSNTTQLRSFPPVEDTIDWIKQVDWEDVKRRSIAGLNNVGLVIALIGEKTYEFGCWLGKIGEEKQAEEVTPLDLGEGSLDIFGDDPAKWPSIRK